MTGPGDVFLALIVVGLPMITFGLVFTRWFRFKEKRIELESGLAVEKAAQYAASNAERRSGHSSRIVLIRSASTPSRVSNVIPSSLNWG